MEGIKIISEVFRMEWPLGLVFITIVISPIFVIAAIITAKDHIDSIRSNRELKKRDWILPLLLIFIVSSVCSWAIIHNINEHIHDPGYIEYTVEPDDTVKINEFYERYQVISYNQGKFKVRLNDQ